MVRTPDPTQTPGPARTPGRTRDAERSDAQLDMLHSFAAKLNVLTDTAEIGSTITAELRTIVDYHNCRVYLLQDGSRLMPIAFRGELTTEYAEEDLDTLITEIGEGITGTVAATREALLTPDARLVPFSVTIPGTDDDLLESMLAVPMVAGDTLVGVIVLSSLGYGMFDEEDQRMVEVLAPHAAAAFQNASLLEAERGAARAAGALLQLSQSLTGRRNAGEIFQRRDRVDGDDHPVRGDRGVRARRVRRLPRDPAARLRGTHRSPAGGDRRRAADARRDVAREQRVAVRRAPRGRRRGARRDRRSCRDPATSSCVRCSGNRGSQAR